MTSAPHLTFFCELPDDALLDLARRPDVMASLRRLGAGVSLALPGLTDARAEAAHAFLEHGIPLVAWMLLPEEGGYWFNAGNAEEAWERYADFRAWSEGHGLTWARVGLDVEPHIEEVRTARQNPLALLPVVARRLFQTDRVGAPRRIYQGLVEAIRADGYPVDAYVVPLIHTERELGTSVLQRVTGILDLDVDREIPMLYTSFVRPDGAGFLELFAPHFPAVAVGVTGGGVEEGVDPPPPLSWAEFERDLRLACRHTDDLHVFSLEGCVERDWLARLEGFRWRWEGPPPVEAADRARLRLRAWGRVMRVLDRPRRWVAGAALLGAGVAVYLGLRRRR